MDPGGCSFGIGTVIRKASNTAWIIRLEKEEENSPPSASPLRRVLTQAYEAPGVPTIRPPYQKTLLENCRIAVIHN